MGLLNDLEQIAMESKPPTERAKAVRRDVTEEDRLAWYDAGSEREKAIRPQTIQEVQKLIQNRNPIRWRQLQRPLPVAAEKDEAHRT